MDESEKDPAEKKAEDRRRPRRASLPAPEGSDPDPHDPPTEQRPDGENDARLRADRPPHWDRGA